MTAKTDRDRLLDLALANLSLQNKLLRAELNRSDPSQHGKSVSILVDQLDRWRRECESFMRETENPLRKKIRNQRRELRRLNRDLSLIRRKQ